MKPEWLLRIQARTGWTDETVLLMALDYMSDIVRCESFQNYLELYEAREDLVAD